MDDISHMKDGSLRDFADCFVGSLLRKSVQTRAVDAILQCPADDRLPLLEGLLHVVRNGAPDTSAGRVSDEAKEWAAGAARIELKAYCLASFKAMPDVDQAAFVTHIRKHELTDADHADFMAFVRGSR